MTHKDCLIPTDKFRAASISSKRRRPLATLFALAAKRRMAELDERELGLAQVLLDQHGAGLARRLPERSGIPLQTGSLIVAQPHTDNAGHGSSPRTVYNRVIVYGYALGVNGRHAPRYGPVDCA